MSSFTFRPAKRENTPLIVGLAGPTKSGKTMSALILAAGLTKDRGRIAMLNTEGPRGEQYADWFEARYGVKYLNCNFEKPFSPERYKEGLLAMKQLNPAVGIVDSATHMHDGPGGLLEYHDAEVERLAGNDKAKQQRVSNGSAWIKPKAAENQAVYAMLELNCPVILCFRAKEKQLLITGKPPVDLGWQPIAGDRMTFETIFTLVLPPRCKGVPDLGQSEMRDPFDKMMKPGKAIDESLGERLQEWAKGTTNSPAEGLPSAGNDNGSAKVQTAVATPNSAGAFTSDELLDLGIACNDAGTTMDALRAWLAGNKLTLETLLPKQKASVGKWIDAQNRR